MINRLRRAWWAGAVLAVLAGLGMAVSADTIVQSFSAQGVVKSGFVVAIKPGSNTVVEAAPAGQSQLMYGLAIDPSQAPVTLQRTTTQQTFVATSGSYPALVSAQNGTINKGDYLSISNTAGIAARATNQQTFIIGQALGSFDGTSGVLSGSGSSAIGRIQIDVLVQRNPWLKENLAVPAFLRSAGDSLAGKEISPIRIYAALGVFLVSAVIAFGALTTGVRSAMTAIGRNPLSRHFILSGLVQVVAVSIFVLSLGMVGVYLLLKL